MFKKKCVGKTKDLCSLIFKTSAPFSSWGFCHCTNSVFFFPLPPAVHTATKTKWRRGREESTVEKLYTHNSVGCWLMCQSINMSASFQPWWDLHISLIIWPKNIWVVIVIFFFFFVLWTHCLAKSLWGVWTDCVFHLVKVFRLQIQRVGFSQNDL